MYEVHGVDVEVHGVDVDVAVHSVDVEVHCVVLLRRRVRRAKVVNHFGGIGFNGVNRFEEICVVKTSYIRMLQIELIVL